MVSNTSNTSCNVASSSVFSTRYSLLIQIRDFNHLNDKVEKYESHDQMPQFFNYGFIAKLKTMNDQGNDGLYDIKQMLTSFNNDAELKKSEATHKAKHLKFQIATQEQNIYKMQETMYKYDFDEYVKANDILHDLEYRRLTQLKIVEDYEFLDVITEKIYSKLSHCVWKHLESEDAETEEIKPKITQETEKLFDYIFEYGKQLEIINNSDMADFETTEKEDENEDEPKEEENEDTDTETDSDDSGSVCSHDLQMELIIERNDYKTKYEEAKEYIESLKSRLEKLKTSRTKNIRTT